VESFYPGNTRSLLERPGILVALKKPSAYSDAYNLSAVVPLTNATPHQEFGNSYVTQPGEDRNEEVDPPRITSEPSLNFRRKIWWDSLLSLYISPTSDRRQNLTPSQRESAVLGITSDIRFLFRESNYWFSFFHVSSFFGNYFDPVKRERMQPSLVLAILAMSTFWQSSEVGLGSHGRDRALQFRDEAQSALDASFNAGWVDETLAQAAWVISFPDSSSTVLTYPYSHAASGDVRDLCTPSPLVRAIIISYARARLHDP
jgi:hypothetical protein